MNKLRWALAFALALNGCANLQSVSSSGAPVYQLNLHGQLDGEPWSGIAVGSESLLHSIEIDSASDVNYMTVQSCHRFASSNDIIDLGWFQSQGSYTFQYSESPGIEDTGECVLRLSAFSKTIGAGQQYGLLIFKNEKFTSPFQNICNGSNELVTGTAACQSAAGLIERVKFETQMIQANLPQGATIPNQCKGQFIDATTFQYTMPAGECVSVFGSTSKPYHYALIFGYGFTASQGASK